MPDRSDKVLRLNEESGQYELPYISKSRVMQWEKNPEHFRLKYLEGIKEPETDAMVRGTRIHESFEYYYEQAVDEHMHFEPAVAPTMLPGERKKWADFIEPYITNFLLWEEDRWQEAGEQVDQYLPIAIEEEHWRDPMLDLAGEPEWMGLADAILPAASIAECPCDEGVVIVDFKTGSVPDPKYRDDGIYMELEYYEILFENKYDVAGAGAYYPREDEFLFQPPDTKFHEKVIQAAREMVQATNEYEGNSQFEAKEGPLCKWGMDDDEESAFYGVCSQCSWGVPANNEETFKAMVDEGYSYDRIADELGTSKDAVSYWKYKMDL
jgi:hypothetical protein